MLHWCNALGLDVPSHMTTFTQLECIISALSNFYKMGTPGLFFVYFGSFQTQILQKITVGFSRIRTEIVGVEGKHADQLTTTTTAPSVA